MAVRLVRLVVVRVASWRTSETDAFGERLMRPTAAGREVPVRFKGSRVEHLRHVRGRLTGWRATWCGHGQEVIPWPRADGWVEIVPVLGEAA